MIYRIDKERQGCFKCEHYINGYKHGKEYRNACNRGNKIVEVPADIRFIKDYPWWRPNWCHFEKARLIRINNRKVEDNDRKSLDDTPTRSKTGRISETLPIWDSGDWEDNEATYRKTVRGKSQFGIADET